MQDAPSPRPTVYLAGPLFTQAEREWNRRLAHQLRSTLEWQVVLPQDFAPPNAADQAGRHAAIFRCCLDGIQAADVLVAVLDGPDVDSGTAFEVGYAHALGKPIVGIRTDYRKLQERGTNLMLSRSCHALVQRCAPTDDVADLAEALAVELASLVPPASTAEGGQAT